MPRPGDPQLLRAIGARLSTARVNAGLSQGQAAAKLGMPRAQTLGDWEAGTANFSVADLHALCVLYQVSADWIIGIAQAPKIGGTGGVIDLAVERAVHAATSWEEIEAGARRMKAWMPEGILFGFRTPHEHEALLGEEWESRKRAIVLKLERLAANATGKRRKDSGGRS